ncbi:teichoic acid transporter [Priestia megaterium]|uniref:oligosaccharide flippase family protein n=1 Tax=Priestia megaterium TaxID=1404 RepID=UPI000BFE8864|nr:oligosaccharide flippase family protein [Priestia megaterium]PGK22471.1 teichoic acid transporter [Priestia megaterium]
MNQRKTGAILTYLVLFAQNLIAILYTPLMLRQLGQSEYGLYSLVISIIGYLSILDLGFGNSIVRYTAKYRALKDKKSEYSLNGMFLILYTIIGLITAILGIFLFFNVNMMFSRSLTSEELRIAKVLVGISVLNLSLSFPLSIFGAIINAYERFIFSKALTLFRIVLNPCIMIPLLLAGYGSIAMISVIAVLNITGLLVNVWYCFKKLKIKVYFNYWNSSLLKEISRYSFFIFLTLIVDKIYWSTNQVILGSTKGSVEVAVYSVGATFTAFFISFTSVIGSLQLPRFTKLVTSGVNDKVISDEFIKLSRLQFILGCFIYGGFLYIGKEFIDLWAGKGYTNAFYIAIIIMTALLFGVTQNSAIAVIQAKKLVKFKSIIQLVIAIVHLGLTIPLSIKYGGIGAAIATFISFFVGNRIILSIYYHKVAKLDMIELWKQILRFFPTYVVITIILIILNFINIPESVVGIILKGILYSIIFFGLIIKFNMNEYEKNQVLSVLLKLRQRFKGYKRNDYYRKNL